MLPGGIPFKGFPREPEKSLGKGKAGQPSEFPLLAKECLHFPGSESEEAVGKGQDASPKKGLFGSHLPVLDVRISQLNWESLLKGADGFILGGSWEGRVPGLLNREARGLDPSSSSGLLTW